MAVRVQAQAFDPGVEVNAMHAANVGVGAVVSFVGYVRDFHAQPELEAAGWLKRVPLPELLHFDGWQRGPDGVGEGLIEAIGQLRPSPRSAA